MKTKTKQTTRTGTESEKWTLHGGISVGREKGGMGGKGTGKRKHGCRHKVNGERLKNGMGNRGLKELTGTTHGHELGAGNAGVLWGQG